MAKKAEKKASSKEPAKAKKAAAPKVEAEKAAPATKAEAPVKKSKAKKESASAKAAAKDERWLEFKEKYGKEKAAKYSMTGQYQPNQAIEHAKLGWGFVLSNNNDRLEVLFEEGVKILISNYGATQKI